MSLPTGQYFIRNQGSKAFVQRSAQEDKSLNPKRVISIPEGVRAQPWLIEQEGSLYVLKAGGAPAFSKDRLVFVSLLEGREAGVKWRLTPLPHVGAHVYLIGAEDGPEGWVLPEEEPYTQVACRPLIMGPSEPPFYPPSQLWSIIPSPADTE